MNITSLVYITKQQILSKGAKEDIEHDRDASCSPEASTMSSFVLSPSKPGSASLNINEWLQILRSCISKFLKLFQSFLSASNLIPPLACKHPRNDELSQTVKRTIGGGGKHGRGCKYKKAYWESNSHWVRIDPRGTWPSYPKNWCWLSEVPLSVGTHILKTNVRRSEDWSRTWLRLVARMWLSCRKLD